MANVAPTGLALYAALCEEIYRRNENDLRIEIDNDLQQNAVTKENIDDDINGSSSTNFILDAKNANTWVIDTEGYIYQMTDPNNASDTTPDNGFVARIVEKDGQYTVVFRGSDLSGGGWDLIQSVVDPQWTPESDGYDWRDNIRLGLGDWSRTQFDDALALTQALIDEVGAANVTVTGQSLGGGLAGLVSAVTGVDGYAFAPAPFTQQIMGMN